MNETSRRKNLTNEVFRNSIVDAAEKLFEINGYENTKIDAIAKAAELSKKTLYTYISSKEEIYDEIAIRSEKAFYEVIGKAFMQGGDMSAVLENMALSTYQLALEKPLYLKILMTMHIRENEFSMENVLHKTIDELDKKTLMLIEKAFKKGIETGYLRSDIDIKFAVIYVITCFMGIMQMLPKKLYYDSITDMPFENYVKSVARTVADTFRKKD